MRKAKAFLIAAAITVVSVFSFTPSSAMVCMEDLQDACSKAGYVICKVAAKGRPCLG